MHSRFTLIVILAGTLGASRVAAESSTAENQKVTGEFSPAEAYIPLLSGAELLSPAPKSITTPRALVVSASQNKFVNVVASGSGATARGHVLRESPDPSRMKPYDHVLQADASTSYKTVEADVRHVVAKTESVRKNAERTAATDGTQTGAKTEKEKDHTGQGLLIALGAILLVAGMTNFMLEHPDKRMGGILVAAGASVVALALLMLSGG
jgi:hypothetical protein